MKWCIICLLPLMALALASREYHYIADPKTWTEAQTYCREKYTDLATIRDKEEMQILNELSLFSGGAWIGLFNKLQNWPSKFTADKDKNSCLYFWIHGGIWTPCLCNLTVAFVCHDVNQYAPHGFNLTLDKKNWTEAQRECQQKHTRLATLRNQEEKDYLKSIIPSGHYGVHMDPYGDGWTWSDDSTPFFFNWLDPAQKHLNSSKRCVASLQTPGSQGRWETQSCTERLPFICYGSESLTTTSTPKPQGLQSVLLNVLVPVKRTQIVRVELQVNSSLNLNIPEVQEVLLHQIKVKLQENGLPADVKLSWIEQADGQIFHKKKDEKRKKEEEMSFEFHTDLLNAVLTGRADFKFISNETTWSNAQHYCREHHTDLASVRNLSENQRVQNLVPSGTDAWIGLFRDVWKWSDGNNSSYRYWKDNEPNNYGNREENCGNTWMPFNGKWNDFPCSSQRPFFCYIEPVMKRQIVRVELQVNSTLDLSNTVVHDKILNQIRMKLQENGLPPNTKLSWIKQPDGQIFHKKKDEKKRQSANKKRKSKDEF
ncbi:uncharacterized protein LOC121690239 [Alosa sapidissima]|uniref:uncharacterized protein LOC121690239 n=1 Tax=Alosa sapidissima TaxID=34773 RepID=UPI001C09E97D|nr:uncharacterized protein LOC121690239 [Alosa sapidissima]